MIYNQLDLAKNQDILLEKMDQLVNLSENSDIYRDMIENRESMIEEKSMDVRDLNTRLDSAKDNILEKESEIRRQKLRILSIDKELEETSLQVNKLRDEKQEIIGTLKREVEMMKK